MLYASGDGLVKETCRIKAVPLAYAEGICVKGTIMRIILKKKITEFTGTASFFEKLTGIDPDNVSERLGELVAQSRQMVKEKLEVAIVYRRSDIIAISEGRVALKSAAADSKRLVGNWELVGDMPPRILRDSKQMISCVMTLCGFEQLQEEVKKQEDIMLEYFLDAWGNTYMEAAQIWFGEYISKELGKEKLVRTHLWSPGQQGFELINQKVLFEMLRPEEIGCTLTESLMIAPVKSASGIYGVVREEAENLLLPCDFCEFGGTCPSSKRKKYSHPDKG